MPGPQASAPDLTFTLHDHTARSVALFGSWDGWRRPHNAAQLEPGVWQITLPPLPPGQHAYKYLLDGVRWLDDPANPAKVHDGYGGFNSVLTIGPPKYQVKERNSLLTPLSSEALDDSRADL